METKSETSSAQAVVNAVAASTRAEERLQVPLLARITELEARIREQDQWLTYSQARRQALCTAQEAACKARVRRRFGLGSRLRFPGLDGWFRGWDDAEEARAMRAG